MTKIFIVGSTGSVGTQCLQVVDNNHELQVVGLSCKGSNLELFADQIKKYRPQVVGLYDARMVQALKSLIGDIVVDIYTHDEALTVASDTSCDCVLVALTGMIAIKTVVACIKKSMRIALANKECLVACGGYITGLAKQHGVDIYPVDSEHSAIKQCILDNKKDANKDINKIILTASGGAFYGYSKEQLATITVAKALKHPTWSMGAKITIDSATMVNKALEIIEAKWLFDTNKIDYCIHPQSIIHGMVEYVDSSIVALLSTPTMHLPISLALMNGQRLNSNYKYKLDYTSYTKLEFLKKREDIFYIPKLALSMLDKDSILPCVLNSANELAVELFLNDKIGFIDIMKIIVYMLNLYGTDNTMPDCENVFYMHADIKNRLIKEYNKIIK